MNVMNVWSGVREVGGTILFAVALLILALFEGAKDIFVWLLGKTIRFARLLIALLLVALTASLPYCLNKLAQLMDSNPGLDTFLETFFAYGMIIILGLLFLAVLLRVVSSLMLILIGSLLGCLIGLIFISLAMDYTKKSQQAEVKPIQPVVAVETLTMDTDEVTRLVSVSVSARNGYGCIKMLEALGANKYITDEPLLVWCMRNMLRTNREIHSRFGSDIVEAPRVCMQADNGRPEVWTMYIRGNDITIVIPQDAKACRHTR